MVIEAVGEACDRSRPGRWLATHSSPGNASFPRNCAPSCDRNRAGKSVALFNVEGQIYAIDDSCMHQGASLGAGKLEGKIVTCRAHGLKFDVTTGFVGGSPGYGVASHAVQVVDGKIAVAV